MTDKRVSSLLAAGLVTLLIGAACGQESRPGDEAIMLFFGGWGTPAEAATQPAPRPVLLYRHSSAAPKPYVQELRTPAGVQLLLDSPPDHVHHRGLMFAVAIDGVNFWEESPSSGRQVSRGARLGPMRLARPVQRDLTDRVEWLAPDGRVLAREQRRIRMVRADAVLVTWRTRLEVARDAELTGNPYFGLGMRFVRGMDRNGRFLNSDNAAGEVVRGEERLYPGRWCAYQAAVDGQPVTVAMFAAPGDGRPTTWFTMAEPFAYLSATLRLHQEPLAVAAAQPLVLTYGIAAWDGTVGPEAIEKLYGHWVEFLNRQRGEGTAP